MVDGFRVGLFRNYFAACRVRVERLEGNAAVVLGWQSRSMGKGPVSQGESIQFAEAARMRSKQMSNFGRN